MRRYIDRKGGLTVEKTEAKDQVQVFKEPNQPINKDVPAGMMLDTMVSYQLPMFTSNPNANGGSECVFCGTKTSYDNRHVCVECWKKYKDEIALGIREAISDVDIHIE